MKTKPDSLNLLVLGFGLVLGAYARILPTQQIGFPVTDGGLFYLMARAIQTNGFALPEFIAYNGATIPFAYPPLGFYVAALVSSVLRVSLIETLRWQPVFFSIAFTIAFYFLASALLKSSFKGMLAAVFFALLPRSVGWFIMGGGITRAPGQLFLILTLYAAYNLFTTQQKKYLWLTIFFGSGAVLSHPESALHTMILSIMLWLFYGRNKTGVKNALLVGLGVAALSAPFFITVIARHGVAPYRNAAETGLYNFTAWLGLITGSFADEKFITVISALAVLGLMITLARREFLPTVWLILPAIVDPRGAASIAIIAWALLAAIAFAEVVIPGLYALQGKSLHENALHLPIARLALTALIFYSFFGIVVADQVYTKISLTESERAAMDWATGNLPSRSRFIIVTGSELAFSDAVSEWFPALTPHISAATVQGYEWLADKPFTARLDEYNALQACLLQDRACLESWQHEYVLVTKESPLANSLTNAAAYTSVYQQDGIGIYKHNP